MEDCYCLILHGLQYQICLNMLTVVQYKKDGPGILKVKFYFITWKCALPAGGTNPSLDLISPINLHPFP